MFSDMYWLSCGVLRLSESMWLRPGTIVPCRKFPELETTATRTESYSFNAAVPTTDRSLIALAQKCEVALQ